MITVSWTAGRRCSSWSRSRNWSRTRASFYWRASETNSVWPFCAGVGARRRGPGAAGAPRPDRAAGRHRQERQRADLAGAAARDQHREGRRDRHRYRALHRLGQRRPDVRQLGGPRQPVDVPGEPRDGGLARVRAADGAERTAPVLGAAGVGLQGPGGPAHWNRGLRHRAAGHAADADDSPARRGRAAQGRQPQWQRPRLQAAAQGRRRAQSRRAASGDRALYGLDHRRQDVRQLGAARHTGHARPRRRDSRLERRRPADGRGRSDALLDSPGPGLQGRSRVAEGDVGVRYRFDTDRIGSSPQSPGPKAPGFRPHMIDPEDDFATLFEASERARRVAKGQIIDGTIVAIGTEVALVSVGGKSEAAIDIGELKDDAGNLEVKVGDRIQAMVVSTAGGLTLSRSLALGAATARQLEDAFEAGLPVEGKVERAVKGGYEVRVARQRAFCPISQIDTIRNTEPAQHEGRVYRFRIIEYKEGGRNLVVSRRVLLEEEQEASAAEVRKSIVEGAVITGRVASVHEFGAFVDLGGRVQGLLHVSEMAWARVSDTSQIV